MQNATNLTHPISATTNVCTTARHHSNSICPFAYVHGPPVTDSLIRTVHKMAKSSRASTKKANNQRLVSKVFGPVEDARQQRLAAKLLEIASQPKPVPEKEMKDVSEEEIEQQTARKTKANDSKRTRQVTW